MLGKAVKWVTTFLAKMFCKSPKQQGMLRQDLPPEFRQPTIRSGGFRLFFGDNQDNIL